MSTDLVRAKLAQSMQIATLEDLIRVKTRTEHVYLLIDVSGSMGTLLQNGKQRIDALRETVADIRRNHEVPMIAFGGLDGGAYVTDVIPSPSGGTPLTQAIHLAQDKQADRVIVISDGIPDSTFSALEAAKQFGGQIDVVFVGDPGEAGEDFLRRLAEASGGSEFHGDLTNIKELSSKILGMLTSGDD